MGLSSRPSKVHQGGMDYAERPMWPLRIPVAGAPAARRLRRVDAHRTNKGAPDVTEGFAARPRLSRSCRTHSAKATTMRADAADLSAVR